MSFTFAVSDTIYLPPPALHEVEQAYIELILASVHDQKVAARILDINLCTLSRRLACYSVAHAQHAGGA